MEGAVDWGVNNTHIGCDQDIVVVSQALDEEVSYIQSKQDGGQTNDKQGDADRQNFMGAQAQY